VKTIDLGAQPGGPLAASWDGKNQDQVPQAPGKYTVKITATADDKKPVAVSQTARGRVTGISYTGGVPQLIVGDFTIPMGSISRIDQPA
jgi:flagellar hook assembly protein FlgD